MLYLVLGFCAVWVSLLGYLLALDRQVRHLHRRLDARRAAGRDQG